jgi:hypothetical protein
MAATKLHSMSLKHIRATIDQARVELEKVVALVTDKASKDRGKQTIQALRELGDAAQGACPQQQYVNLLLSDRAHARLMTPQRKRRKR